MGKPDEIDREMIRRGDRIGADLARYLLRCHDERERMAQDWCDFCEMMGVEVDSHEAVVDAICIPYQNAVLEAEAVLREIAKEYDGEDCPYPVPLDQIGAELRKRQRAARDYFAKVAKDPSWSVNSANRADANWGKPEPSEPADPHWYDRLINEPD